MKLNHLLIPYLAILAFMFGGIINSGGIAWYHTLTLPAWNPPAGIIALIWAIIYTFAAWSLLIVWNKTQHDTRFSWSIGGFVATTLVNLVWSLVFFQFHQLMLATWCALLLGLLTLVLIALVYPRSPKAALLLVPYMAWIFFATYLTYVVSTLNP